MKRKPLNKFLQRQIFESLDLVLAHKNKDQVSEILRDITSTPERDRIAKRLAIAIFLDKGRSYEDIQHNLKVSAREINWVGERQGNPGFQAAILELKAERWAEHWSQQIGSLVRRLLPK